MRGAGPWLAGGVMSAGNVASAVVLFVMAFAGVACLLTGKGLQMALGLGLLAVAFFTVRAWWDDHKAGLS